MERADGLATRTSLALATRPFAESAKLVSESKWYPRQDSNLCTRFRKPVLYPLSYGGDHSHGIASLPASASDLVDSGVRRSPYWKESEESEIIGGDSFA